jgi:hypothetical protein
MPRPGPGPGRRQAGRARSVAETVAEYSPAAPTAMTTSRRRCPRRSPPTAGGGNAPHAAVVYCSLVAYQLRRGFGLRWLNVQVACVLGFEGDANPLAVRGAAKWQVLP